MVDAGTSYFVPVCREQSFESPFAALSDDAQLNILQHSLSIDPLSCPKNCACYKNRKWVMAKSATGKIFKGLYETVRNLLKGFAELSWQTQVAIITLLVLFISPKWVPLVISLAKAIWGKTP